MKLFKPCGKCPYKLGLVKTLIDPCPQCKLDGYSACEHFLKQIRELHKQTEEETINLGEDKS